MPLFTVSRKAAWSLVQAFGIEADAGKAIQILLLYGSHREIKALLLSSFVRGGQGDTGNVSCSRRLLERATKAKRRVALKNRNSKSTI